MTKILLALHRWLGVALGILMSVWCLSGFVMMYVRYPELTGEEAVRGLAPLDLQACCRIPADLGAGGPVASFRVEMLAGEPVLRVRSVFGTSELYSLVSGRPIDALDVERARRVARDFLLRSGIRAGLERETLVERDQWTVSGSFDCRPA